MREIEFYRTASGRCPVQEFIDGCSTKEARKIWKVLRMVGSLHLVSAQYLKKLVATDGLWEVRVQHGGNSFRFLGFFSGARLVVLVSGFAKKSDAVPDHEIMLARQRRRDYHERDRSDG